MPLRIFLIEAQTKYPCGRNVSFQRATTSTVYPDPNQRHQQEINSNTTGVFCRIGGLQMWPCQQPHQTWHCTLPHPVSRSSCKAFFLRASPALTHALRLSVPVNDDPRTSCPRIILPAESQAAQISRKDEGLEPPFPRL